MKSTLFLPKEIKVGFTARKDTYTGKLAYIIYIDEKGVLRKEKSFESWRNKDIPTEQLNNEPLSGFVLNKKVGGYASGWNHRQTAVRVYDPRGFEFEITVENLLYILDNTNSIVGKGLEGEFVYAWSGSDIILLPVSAPEYEDLKKLNELRHKKEYIKAKDLTVGATYLSKNNEELVYLGKFFKYGSFYNDDTQSKSEKKQFFFATSNKREQKDKERVLREAHDVVTYPSVYQKFINVIDEREHPDFVDMWSDLEGNAIYSPVNQQATMFETVEKEQFLKFFETEDFTFVFDEKGSSYWIRNWRDSLNFVNTKGNQKYNEYNKIVHESPSLEQIYDILRPKIKHLYLENGRHYKTIGLR